ncbi:MAG: hypothetical protein OEY95_04420 [Candidatus Bathyarchaeota archaeon]|nr:hypothetical protein [Candidatus Bathyarchaeota archaeon]
MSDELAELRKISKILILANAKAIEDELSKYATTDERKKIWVLMDGNRMSKEIARSIGVTTRTVDKFLKALESAELVENPWGKPPKRILDYVPASWLELIKIEVATEEEQKSERVG